MMDPDAVRLQRFAGAWADDDPDANFKREVAEYSRADPLPTLRRLSDALDIPVGALVRYVLVKWESEGSETLLSAGPGTVERMWRLVESAEADGSDQARLDAWDALRQIIAWLRAPVAEQTDDPATPG